MTRVAVETLAVSSSRSECIVSGSRFTVSTLMSSFLRVTSLRPETGEGSLTLPASLCSSHFWTHLGWEVQIPPPPPRDPEALPAGNPGSSGSGLFPSGPILTAFAAPVKEERQGDEEDGEQNACADGGSGNDAHR